MWSKEYTCSLTHFNNINKIAILDFSCKICGSPGESAGGSRGRGPRNSYIATGTPDGGLGWVGHCLSQRGWQSTRGRVSQRNACCVWKTKTRAARGPPWETSAVHDWGHVSGMSHAFVWNCYPSRMLLLSTDFLETGAKRQVQRLSIRGGRLGSCGRGGPVHPLAHTWRSHWRSRYTE